MRRACETRKAAWDSLRNGQYWTFVGGNFILTLLMGIATVILVLFAIMASVMLWIGMFGTSTEWWGSSARFQEFICVNIERMGPEVFFAVAFVGLMLVANIVIIPFVFILGFVKWGVTQLAFATSRQAIRFELAFSGLSHGWKLGWVIVVRETYTFLWSLLLIVLGIVKAFSYAMTDYIAVEHPDWTATACIDESQRLMDGDKWRLLCLELSFIGWYFLLAVANYFSNGIAGYFFTPYSQMALVKFYEELKAEKGQVTFT